jgi:hypothetical protein
MQGLPYDLTYNTSSMLVVLSYAGCSLTAIRLFKYQKSKRDASTIANPAAFRLRRSGYARAKISGFEMYICISATFLLSVVVP